jgi:predicted molibdopterin-dependent oxidoreductase YjgC
MMDAAMAGSLKAMIVVGDNPLMFAPGTARIREALEALDLLIVVDDVLTDTAKLAHCLFADVPTYAKTGTFSNAERRVQRLHAALDALGDARPALLALTGLANAVRPDAFTYDHPDDVTDEIASNVAGYEPFSSRFERWGKVRIADVPSKGEVQVVASLPAPTGELVLTTGRTLFTSIDGAATHSEDADKLHTEEFVEMHPADAANRRLADGAEVVLVTDSGEITLPVKLSDRVQEGALFIPYYLDGGAVCALFGADGAPASVQIRVAAAV